VSAHLIVNADDLGASVGVNRGIERCHREGIVTSASLMVTGAGADDAAATARANPELAVGLHWDLVGEDEREFDLSDERAVRDEFAAQLERFHELMESAPTHVDSHRHMHLTDALRELVRELVAPLGVPLRGDGRVFFIGGFYAQWEWGVTELEHISVQALQRILREEVGEGWTEISCHPGYITPGYRSTYSSEREAEIRTLTDSRVRVTIAELGITLESYATYRERAEAR
jgi:chitin disaccharide deacetylase